MTKLIVFEGIDGTGKTTVSNIVADYLGATWTKEPYLYHRQPGRTWSDDVLEYTRDRIAHLAFMRTKTGRVICDRYWYSTVAYQCATYEVTMGQIIPDDVYQWIVATSRPPGLIVPDLVIRLTCDTVVAAKRAGDGVTNPELLNAVNSWYDRIFKDLTMVGCKYIEVDTTYISARDVASEIMSIPLIR